MTYSSIPEFIHDDRDAITMMFGENAPEKNRSYRKIGYNGCRPTLGVWISLHQEIQK